MITRARLKAGKGQASAVCCLLLVVPVALLVGGCSSAGGASSTGGSRGGTGGIAGSGGTAGPDGGAGSGGGLGSGGAAASGGTSGAGGQPGSGGATGAGGGSAWGGAAGGQGGTAMSTGGGGGRDAQGGKGGNAGKGGRGGSSGAGGSTTPPVLTLTSPVLMEGGMFAAGNTCADPGMGSPELDWTPGPPGTMSYGITLTDLTSAVVQWAIWNIPAPGGTPAQIILPAHLDTIAMLTTPPGAVQINSFNGRGYYGPCLAGGTHTYQFQVYAIPISSLPGTATSTEAARSSMQAAATATGTLTATSNATH